MELIWFHGSIKDRYNLSNFSGWPLNTEDLYLHVYNAVQSVESQRTFRTISPSSPESKSNKWLFDGFLRGLLFYPENVGDIFLRNVGWLYDIIFKKTELFITIAVTTSNPKYTFYNRVCEYNAAPKWFEVGQPRYKSFHYIIQYLLLEHASWTFQHNIFRILARFMTQIFFFIFFSSLRLCPFTAWLNDVKINFSKKKMQVDSKRFWRWFITHRITRFLDFFHRPVF
jgi:hypothetical protein